MLSQTVVPIIIFICGFFVLTKSNKCVLTILVIGCFFFDCFSFSSLSIGKFSNFITFCLFLRLIYTYKDSIEEIKKTPLLFLALLILSGGVICVLSSPHLSDISSILSFFLFQLGVYSLMIVYSFVLLKNNRDFEFLIRTSYNCLIIITILGVLNLIAGTSIWLDIFSNEISLADINSERSHLFSSFIYSFDYGEMCNIMLYVILYSKEQKIISSKKFLIGIICALFGILMCGSRSVIICGAIGFVAYRLLLYNKYDNIKFLSIGLLLFIPALFCMPQLYEKISFIGSTFDVDSNVSGSNVNMRVGQYLTVLYIVKDNLLFGKGFHYFFFDLGWNSGLNVAQLPYPDLAGMEGVLMQQLLERGIIGVLIYIIFYISLLIYAYKLRKYDVISSGTCIAILVSFIVFGNMTGELNSALPALLFAGLFLKRAYLSKMRLNN